jgi:two-component system NtrC family sensor kinase
MPGMSGIELSHHVRQHSPETPVVLATGYSEQAARDAEGLAIVLKPYSAADLSTAMARALTRGSGAPASTTGK